MKKNNNDYSKYVIGNNRSAGSDDMLSNQGGGFPVAVAIIVMCLIVALVIMFVLPFREVDETTTDAPKTATETKTEQTAEPTAPATEPEPTKTAEPTDEPTTEPTAEPTDDPTADPTSYNFVIVPESARVDASYFANDTLFIGDSLTVGLQLYSGLKSNYYCFVGMSTYNAFKQEFIEKYGTQITLGDALRSDGGKWKRIYIQIGVNELYQELGTYVRDYEKVIDTVLEYCPNAKIYVQSVFPMTAASAAKDTYSQYGGNDKLAGFNRSLVEMCSRRGFYYVNVAANLTDAGGNLPVPYAGADGIHLLPTSYKIWVDYLYTHTAD